jgi:peptidoglycan/LPS O-acetylase OafA/YrhL
MRRVLRLFPGLALLLLALTAWALGRWAWHPAMRGESVDLLKAVCATLTYSANWVDALHLFRNGLASLGVAWSLSLEEQFYLVWPVVLIFLLREACPPRRMLALTGLCVTAVAVLRWRLLADGYPWYRVYFGADTRADSLLYGCALGIIATSGWLPRLPTGVTRLGTAAAFSAAALTVMALRQPDPDYLGRGQIFLYSLAAISTAVVIGWLLISPDERVTRVLRVRGLAWIGRLSYGLYLWHLPFIIYLRPAAVPLPLLPLLQMAVTAAVVLGSWHFVERPALRLKARVSSEPVSAPRPAPSGALVNVRIRS